MTIDEAISHEERNLEINKLIGEVSDCEPTNAIAYHRQLVEWLKELKQLREQTRWIPVSDGLPEDEQEIQFSTKTGRVHFGKYHDDDSANQWYSYRDKCRAWNNVVTAWMPSPEPFKAESEDAGCPQ